jgi:lipopolysaccharide transport system permease protein
MLVLAALMFYYHFIPSLAILLFPFLVGLTFLCALGVGLWLSALNVQYRDIRYVIPFLIQLWMFVSPVIYPVSIVKEEYRWLLALNPMGGLIKAYRASILHHLPVDWFLLNLSTTMIFALFISGLYYFRRMERYFADIV